MADDKRPEASAAKVGNSALTAASFVALAATMAAVYLLAPRWPWQDVAWLAFGGVALTAVLGFLGDRTSMRVVRAETDQLVGFEHSGPIPSGDGEIAVEATRVTAVTGDDGDSFDWKYDYNVVWRGAGKAQLLETFRDPVHARAYAERLCVQGGYTMSWSGIDDVTERRATDELDLPLTERLRREPGRVPPMPPVASRPRSLSAVPGGGVRMKLNRFDLVRASRTGFALCGVAALVYFDPQSRFLELIHEPVVQGFFALFVGFELVRALQTDELTATPAGVTLRRRFLGIPWRNKELPGLEAIYVENRTTKTQLALATDDEYLLVGAFGRIDDAHRARGLLYRGLAGAGLKED